MIPEIEDIVDGLIAGTTSREQALAWLHTHLQLAANDGDDDALIDGLAMGVMEGIHAHGGRVPSALEESTVRYAYRIARLAAAVRDSDELADA